MKLTVVALAASVGGLPALQTLLGALPADFPAAVVVVQHICPDVPSLMADILSHHTLLKVKQVEDGEPLLAGVVFIAPPDHHLLVNAEGTLSLSQSPRVHFVRPSAEPLFKSVAVVFKERAIAVVLTGGGSDGSEGVQIIKQMGGTVIAQDQASSEIFGMPQAAIATGCVDFVLPLDQISRTLVEMVGRDGQPGHPSTPDPPVTGPPLQVTDRRS